MSVLPEQWRPFPRNPKYEISDQGRARRVNSDKCLKPIFNGHIYGVAILPNNKKCCLARAVWETFRGPIPEGYIVVYKNGCNSMTDLYNLELMKEKDFKAREQARKNKARSIKVKDNKTGKIYNSITEAEKALYVGAGTIGPILRGETKKTRTGVSVSYVGRVEES